MSTSDYDPRYLELWRDAAATPIKLPALGRTDAFTFRHRLYRCRQAMKAEKHEWYDLAKTVSINVIMVYGEKEASVNGKEAIPDGATFHLLMRNPDQRFADALLQAGYQPPKAPSLD